MADAISIKVHGLDVLEKRLKELDRRTTGNVLRVGLREGMNILKEEAKLRVPVRTGKLKKGIQVTVTLKKKGDCYAKLGFKRAVAYGVPVELGTSHSAAKPFLRPAMDIKHPQAVTAFANRLKTEIDKAAAV